MELWHFRPAKVCREGGFWPCPLSAVTSCLLKSTSEDLQRRVRSSIACWFSRSPRESADGGIPNSAEKSCADFTTPTRFDDRPQELKSFLIQALDEHHVLDNANLRPTANCRSWSKISSSVFFAEMVLGRRSRRMESSRGLGDSRAVMLFVPDAESSKQLDARFRARAQRLQETERSELTHGAMRREHSRGTQGPGCTSNAKPSHWCTAGSSNTYSKVRRT